MLILTRKEFNELCYRGRVLEKIGHYNNGRKFRFWEVFYEGFYIVGLPYQKDKVVITKHYL